MLHHVLCLDGYKQLDEILQVWHVSYWQLRVNDSLLASAKRGTVFNQTLPFSLSSSPFSLNSSWIPEADGSWALPLKHERITSFETPTSRAAFQLKQVSKQLKIRPLAAYDRGYGNAKFV